MAAARLVVRFVWALVESQMHLESSSRWGLLLDPQWPSLLPPDVPFTLFVEGPPLPKVVLMKAALPFIVPVLPPSEEFSFIDDSSGKSARGLASMRARRPAMPPGLARPPPLIPLFVSRSFLTLLLPSHQHAPIHRGPLV